MGLLGKLFGSQKATETLMTGAVKGLDAIVFTQEEKSEFIKDMVIKLQDQWLPRAISRRVIAIVMTSVFCLFLVTALIFACLENQTTINLIIETAKAFQLGWIQLTIIVFYFGYYGFSFGKKKPNGKG